jgi:hypothetical protein
MTDDAREIKRREDRLRRFARRQGLALRKSRVRRPHLDDHGGYRIIDADRNYIVAGEKFNLTLDDVDDYLRESWGANP